jgi:hypothetical protein
MWLDLLLILLAISPLMRTTRFLVRNSASLYVRGDEGITALPARLQAAPAGQPHPAPEA